MRKSGGAGKKQPPDAIDEVEELLKLTEDDLLLKLTVNSQIKSKSKSKFDIDLVSESSHSIAIDPDLDRRFQALRSKPNPKTKITASDEDVDDLFARFAALKAPNTTPASNSTSEDMKIVKDENEEDEVQKIINWAIDAARLYPSPSSDIDDGDDDNDNYEDDDDDDSDEDEDTPTVARKKEGSKK